MDMAVREGEIQEVPNHSSPTPRQFQPSSGSVRVPITPARHRVFGLDEQTASRFQAIAAMSGSAFLGWGIAGIWGTIIGILIVIALLILSARK